MALSQFASPWKHWRRSRPWIAMATAHPYKFAETVEPLIGQAVERIPALAAVHNRSTCKIRIGANLDALADALRERAVAA